MKKFTILPLAFSLLSPYTACSEKIPSYVTPCKRDSEDLNLCIVNAWEELRPYVGEGIPKLKIPPLEPYFLTKMNMDKKSETLDINIILSQLTIMGLTKVMVSKLNVDLADLSGSVTLAFSDLNVTTLYVLDALLMKIIPMKGQGKYNGIISDVRVNLTGKAKLSPKNEHGKSYLKLLQLKLNMFIGSVVGQMVDTSNVEDNDLFTQTANLYFEDNKREVLDILVPIIEEFCESLVLDSANQILSAVSFEAMFTTIS